MTSAAPRTHHSAVFATDRANIREARRTGTAVMRSWDIPDDVLDDAILVISELTTNAVRHTTSARFRLDLRLEGPDLHISVHDESAMTRPLRIGIGEEAEWGRGIGLVASVCSQWGTQPAENGKNVWAVLALRASA